MVSQANRSFFTTKVVYDSQVLFSRLIFWKDVKRKVSTDLQRQYLAAILGLEYFRAMLDVTWIGPRPSITLRINSKHVMKQLMGKIQPSNVEIATLKSELIGLVTRMGVTIDKTNFT